MARRLTDEELFSARFRHSDPERTISDLCRERPDATAEPTIVGFYDERPFGGRAINPDAPYVWCCHCQRETHWEGFVVRDSSGSTYIIGSQCGRRHYGGDFFAVEKRFNEERVRKAALTQWVRMIARLDELERALKSLFADKYLELHDRTHRELLAASQVAYNRLRASVQRGALVVHERVRDLSAEEERAERYRKAVEAFGRLPIRERKEQEWRGLAPEEDTSPILNDVTRHLGHVVGTSLLGIGDVRKDAAEVRRHLIAMREAERKGTEAHDTRTLMQLRKHVSKSVDTLRQNLIATSFCETFFERANLDRLEAWSSPFRDFQYSRRGKHLHVWDRDRGETLVHAIPPGNIPALQALEPFHITVVEDDLEDAGAAFAENENDPFSRRYVA